MPESDKILLFKGMEYDSKHKWWPDHGVRPTCHEGIDICYYGQREKVTGQLSLSTLLPVIEAGKVIAICSDFLGQSVFVEHKREKNCRFVSAYAHIIPQDAICIGHDLAEGGVVGTIADTAGRKNRMPAHLHLTLMRAPLTVSPELYDWNLLCERECVELLNPLSYLHEDEYILLGENPVKTIEMSG